MALLEGGSSHPSGVSNDLSSHTVRTVTWRPCNLCARSVHITLPVVYEGA